jgi:hypothetical protein
LSNGRYDRPDLVAGGIARDWIVDRCSDSRDSVPVITRLALDDGDLAVVVEATAPDVPMGALNRECSRC